MSADSYKIRSILNPTDFTAGSIGSFCHALRIAIANRSALHLLHVEVSGKRREDTHFPRVRELAAQWKMVPSDIQQSEFEKLTGVVAKKTVWHALSATGGIASYVDEHRCDLLVMTSHDRSTFRRLISGSVSAAAARATHTPALFLREGHSGFVKANTGETSLTRIVAPVDGRIPTTGAWELATHLARSLGCEPQIFPLHIGRETPEQYRRMPNLARRDGAVVETILAFAEEIHADLIVMPTEGRDGPVDAVFGSTTERVIQEAPCPVLAVPQTRSE